MRAALLCLVLAACAHTTGPRPINVAAVRHEIADQIEDSNDPRPITSMGKVTEQSAVVYTTRGDQRQEEHWVRIPGGWKLERAELVGATSPPQPGT
ncbi:MAG: hypothetical protein AB7O24_20470 [Kofleriaceae bacterium]